MQRISEQRIFDLIGSFYDVAQQSSSEPWLEVYKDMADLFGAGPGGYSAFDQRAKSFSVIGTTAEMVLLDEYHDHFQHINPLHTPISTLEPEMRFNRQDIIDDDEFRRHEVYQDYYRKVHHFHIEYRTFLKYDQSYAGILFTRRDGQPNFTTRETTVMTYLMPHLARAFKLHFNLLDAHRQNRVITDAFDHIPQGVIVVDRDRKLVFANACATDLLNGGNGLRLNAKGSVETSTKNRHFERMVADIFDRHAFEPDKFGGVAIVERSGDLRPLEVLITPFRHEAFGGTNSESLAIIYVTDPEAKVADMTGVLMQIYGLTSTEARLAQLIVNGQSLSEACDEMSIAENTGRAHLKRIFSKTDTNRQSALVKLILNGPAHIRCANKAGLSSLKPENGAERSGQ